MEGRGPGLNPSSSLTLPCHIAGHTSIQANEQANKKRGKRVRLQTSEPLDKQTVNQSNQIKINQSISQINESTKQPITPQPALQKKLKSLRRPLSLLLALHKGRQENSPYFFLGCSKCMLRIGKRRQRAFYLSFAFEQPVPARGSAGTK